MWNYWGFSTIIMDSFTFSNSFCLKVLNPMKPFRWFEGERPTEIRMGPRMKMWIIYLSIVENQHLICADSSPIMIISILSKFFLNIDRNVLLYSIWCNYMSSTEKLRKICYFENTFYNTNKKSVVFNVSLNWEKLAVSVTTTN